MTGREKVVNEFNRVKLLGWVKSNRANNTGIGKTFEDLIGVVENNVKEPDFAGYEIKSQRSLCGSYVTLFTKSPTGPKKANAFLKDSFGTPYEEHPNIKNCTRRYLLIVLIHTKADWHSSLLMTA